MTTEYAHVPNPLPDPEIGTHGYEMWCLAAEYRPSWLASLNDPHSHFAAVETKYNQLVALYADKMSGPGQSDSIQWLNLDRAHAAARREIVDSMPPPEVTKPVWDHLDPMEDPALDQAKPPLGASPDWTQPEPTLSDLMEQEIKKNS